MELIRTKRATSTAGANTSTGQPKSKYRKRSVSLLGLLKLVSDFFSSAFLVWTAGNSSRQMSLL